MFHTAGIFYHDSLPDFNRNVEKMDIIVTIHGPTPAGLRPSVLRTSAAPAALLSEAVAAVPVSQASHELVIGPVHEIMTGPDYQFVRP